MTCEFNDGLKVSYCGPLRIKKEGRINLYLDRNEVWDEISPDLHGDLLDAALHGNCDSLRHVADELTDSFGPKFHQRRTVE